MPRYNWHAYRNGEFCKMGEGYNREQDRDYDAHEVLADTVGSYDRVELLTDGNLQSTLTPHQHTERLK